MLLYDWFMGQMLYCDWLLTLLWTMARVSTHTRQPPYSNLMAWWSSILDSQSEVSIRVT